MKFRMYIMPQFIILLSSFLVFTSCNHLLYPAERSSYIEAKYIKPSPQNIYISVSETEKIHAWHFTSESKIKKGIVLHFHGNGQNLTTHFQFFRWMTQFGFDYIVFDYRGYGQSSGQQATQKTTVQDGLAVIKYVKENFKNLPFITIGQSLGSNVLVRTLQDIDPLLYPDMVVLDSSFLSYRAAARSILKQRWFLYPIIPLTYLAIDDDFSAAQNLKKNPIIPALFFHGTDDVIISTDLGKQNFELWPGPKHLILNQGGGHIAAFGDARFANKNKEILLSCFEQIVAHKISNFNLCALK